MQKFVKRFHKTLEKWRKKGGIITHGIVGRAVAGVARSVAEDDEE